MLGFDNGCRWWFRRSCTADELRQWWDGGGQISSGGDVVMMFSCESRWIGIEV